MTHLIGGDCLENLETFEPNSIDLIFCDLPYGQTSCKWDCLIDLDILWKHFMRIKKLNTPIIMTCTTKFGVSLINSAPKKCPFRYDLVWCKSASAGFLSAKKMPMRKHEMIYIFYEKLPFYDLSSHKHKFIKEDNKEKNSNYETCYGNVNIPKHPDKKGGSRWDPPLPTSLVKENCNYDVNKNAYGGGKDGRIKISKDKKDHVAKYEPPLPTSLIKGQTLGDKGNECYGKFSYYNNGVMGYEPPLPTSLVKEEQNDVYDYTKRIKNGKLKETGNAQFEGANGKPLYEPPLPDSLLEIKSTRGKHSTEKPVELMKWILKYYSKEGDLVLDPTMGSGSMGVACEEMKRNFIGIEKDEEIFGVAWERLNG